MCKSGTERNVRDWPSHGDVGSRGRAASKVMAQVRSSESQ